MNGLDPCPNCGRDMEHVVPPDGVMTREPWVRCRWCLANRLEAHDRGLEKVDVDLVYARRESQETILELEAEGAWL